MSFGSIVGYQGASNVEVLSDGDKKFVKVYNGTGSALARGAIGRLSYKWISGSGVVGYFVGGAFATNTAQGEKVAVVCNFPKGKNTIPDGEYGYVQIAGLCDYVATSGTVAANDQLQIIDSGTAMIDQGTDGGAKIAGDTCGIAVANVATDVWQVYLIDKYSTIAAS